MSDVDYDDDDFDGGDANESNAMQQVRKQLRQAQKREKELADLVAGFQKKERASTIAGVLAEKGASPKLARFVDLEGDVTPEAVQGWLAENGELFGWTDPSADRDPAEEQAQRISQAAANARPQTFSGGNQGHLERLEASKGDPNAEAQALRQLGFRV